MMSFIKRFWHQTLKRPYKLHRSFSVGSGNPVLLIHGLGTSGESWRPMINVTNTKKWKLVAYDLLGFGKSPKPDNLSYDVEVHARSLVASLNKNTRKNLVIVGHSMGCLVASHIAATRPGMVKRLILYEPPLFADSPEFRSHKRRKQFYFAFYEEVLKRPKILIAYSKFLARYTSRAVLNLEKDSWVPFERSLQNTIMKQKAYNELKHIKVPTDIIYGQFDFIVTRKDVKDMLNANKYIKFHLVNEMHDITVRAAKYINKLLEKHS